eukprot:CAMPEP_0177499736 /NCGR_PEP_ID=MMETSP0369-20130122/36291_1 /TAXON_ID=447022 ORGANISM="Scrippsiella hangoei-like, Strain SHHI-4" /NCGR_SAMPLE_ID=MMETSP0369 /ASSEMBLY_ACC=CAM_ASM_000364 /LENGTH=239 /DNA_ID=CAMNT_0018977077 /DNA_START=191 /DNA_END=907 /DNA_ORIENTATION=+
MSTDSRPSVVPRCLAAAEAEGAAKTTAGVGLGVHVVGLTWGRPGVERDEVPGVDVKVLQPLEVVVLARAEPLPDVTEVLAQHVVVRALLEVQGPSVLEVGLKLVGEACAQRAQRSVLLLLTDLPVLLLLVLGIKARPRQDAAQKVEQHVANGFQVVATALLHAAVGVDGGVASRACKAQLVAHHDMGLVVIAFAKAEIDHVQVVDLALGAPHEVLGLDVSVHNAFRVQVLHAPDELIGD